MYSVRNDVITLELSSDELDLLEEVVNKFIPLCYNDKEKEVTELHSKLINEQKLRNSLCECTVFISKKEFISISNYIDDFYEVRKGSYWKIDNVYLKTVVLINLTDGTSITISKKDLKKLFKEIKRC